MASILPFRRTQALINEIDEFLDKVSEATMTLEQTVEHYVDTGPDDYLDEKLQQIFETETRGDEVRRGIATVMYTQMLMPDTRGDVLTLLDELDNVLDDCTHLVARIAVMRPQIPHQFHAPIKALTAEVTKSAEYMVRAARAYFKDPSAVRDHVHKISFHETEATKMTIRLGKTIFDSDLPLENKRLLADWIVGIREIASHADDVGDRTAILAVKRSL